jgi:hypothetical protein
MRAKPQNQNRPAHGRPPGDDGTGQIAERGRLKGSAPDDLAAKLGDGDKRPRGEEHPERKVPGAVADQAGPVPGAGTDLTPTRDEVAAE